MSTVPPSLIPVSNNNSTAKDVSKVEIEDDERVMTSSNENQYESAEPTHNPRGMDNDSSSKTLHEPALNADALSNGDVSRDESMI